MKKNFLRIQYNSGELMPYDVTRLESQQLFVSRIMSPDSKHDRLFVAHIPGSGKTISGLSAAINYLRLFRQFPEQDYNVIILGFNKPIFLDEMMSRPELGYITESDFTTLVELKNSGDEEKYNKFYNYVRKKITGVLFYGYQELANMIFPETGRNTSADILELFKKCFIICDEVHNIYNSIEINNYGKTIRHILDWHLDLKETDKFMKIIFMSATPINNNPAEIIDILNILVPRANYKTPDFFSPAGKLLPGALKKIAKISEGYFSFYSNNDPQFFPEWYFSGEKVSGIKFLRFILCPISPAHLSVYKTLDTLPVDSTNIVDGVFPIRPGSEPKSAKKRENKENRENREENKRNIKEKKENKENREENKRNIKENNENREENNENKEENNENREENNENIEENEDKKGMGEKTDDILGFKTADFNVLNLQPEKWLQKHGIIPIEGTLGGTILQKDNIKKYCSKYHKMLEDLFDNLRNDGGKIIIEHENVHGTGIKMIEQILLENGFISEYSQPSSTTLCSICGIPEGSHKRQGGDDVDFTSMPGTEFVPDDLKTDINQMQTSGIFGTGENKRHDFMPARYVLVIGEIDKKISKISITKFNSLDNHFGHKIKVLLGSEVIRESYNFLGVENFWIMRFPSSVSTFIQLLGRPVRKNSHSSMPPDRRRVEFRIYITDTPKNVLNFEKEKFRIKMQNYSIIREIEKVIHEVAIDNNIYFDLNKKSFVTQDDIGTLPFKRNTAGSLGVKISSNDKMLIELGEMKALIIGYFHKYRVWTYKDLWQKIQKPDFVHFIDTSYFTEDEFALALGDLIYGNNWIEMNGGKYVIVENKSLLILYPMAQYCEQTILGCDKKGLDGIPIITPTSWIDEPDKTNILSIDITDKLISLNSNYEEMKLNFYKKFHNADILTIPKSTEVYGIGFHERLIEDSIAYIFNLLTGTTEKSEFHVLYFKMVNFYEKIDLIIYANAVPEEYLKYYSQYITGDTNTNTLLMEKTQSSTLSSFELTEIDAFLKKKHNKIPSNILPIGHFLTQGDSQRFYTPQGWFSGKIFVKEVETVENDIIIGFYERAEDSIEYKFKLRSPAHKIKKEKDSRLQETGVVCETRKKDFLFDIAKKLGLAPVGSSQKVCEMIKQDLMHRELKDRNKFKKGLVNIRTRWCYLQTEVPGNV